MEEADYIVFLARACRGLFDGARDDHDRPITVYDYIRHHLPLAQGNALMHSAAIAEGNVMIWENPQLSKRGRWWLKVRQMFRRTNNELADKRG